MIPAGSSRPAGAACDLITPLRAPLPGRERIGLGMHLSRSCEVGCLHLIRTCPTSDFYHLCHSFLEKAENNLWDRLYTVFSLAKRKRQRAELSGASHFRPAPLIPRGYVLLAPPPPLFPTSWMIHSISFANWGMAFTRWSMISWRRSSSSFPFTMLAWSISGL